MDDNSQETFGAQSLMDNWLQALNTLAETFMTTESQPGKDFGAGQQKNDTRGYNTAADTAQTLKSWQTLFSGMATQEFMASVFKDVHTMPEIFIKFSRDLMDSLPELEAKIIKDADRFKESVDTCGAGEAVELFFQDWARLYKNELQHLFQFSMFGWAMEYQEKLIALAGKFQQFQDHRTCLLSMLDKPFQESVREIKQKISQLSRAGDLPEDSREYYRMWIKILEARFCVLFRTPAYIETLTCTINSLADFSKTKNTVIEDMIQGLPIARQSEVNDLTREVYELKRRIRRLEKKGHK